ncbi:MAG: DUF2723 domain-containing protein [Ichthyobacteriaceae bacterium]|nr:DUF2723 domain-containing protein [Ichthyobacteriaceae bacterium]
MELFKKWNNITGWVIFAIASFTYLATIEPTASFWDCGEYISTAVKLEVGHPPGAPLFQMLGAVISIFAFGDVMQMAKMVNMMSALSSSFAILFLFWSITHLVRKAAMKEGELTKANTIAILGSGVVGALGFTFTDTFWFSAAEGEVYAMAMLFIAMVFWMGLKWEDEAEDSRSSRWIVLISYIYGLAIGVHLMVILTIPAIGFIIFFKKYKNVDFKSFVIANVVIVAVLGFVFKIVFPLTMMYLGKVELFFVNTMELPFHGGTIIGGIILVAAFVMALMFTRKKDWHIANTVVLALMFMLIGFSNYLMLSIRANTNTPINENNPSTAVTLLDYYNRIQYGEWPVIYGAMYTAYEGGLKLDEQRPYFDGTPLYEADTAEGKYIMVDDKKGTKYNFDKKHVGLWARMYSHNPSHIEMYKAIAGNPKPGQRPTFGQNMKYFLDYQVGYMYMRYFMWNFVGKQNDIQGKYEPTHGNWMSGINFIDEARLGPQDNLPKDLANNKARNTYYFFPLILGLIGLIFHFKHNKKDAYSIFLLFILTGIAILVYTSPKPFEPRERDYALVGSFYAFAIWMGIGVWAIYKELYSKLSGKVDAKVLAISTTVVLSLLVPGILAKENWNDHDRSGRTAARDLAKMYLDSVDKNAILFTYGDNDTFPLWYVQEVEGYRTDVKIVNLSLLNTDWYVDQMKMDTYDAKAIPSQMTHNLYRQGTRDVAYFYDKYGISDKRITAKQFIDWIASDDDKTKVQFSENGTEVIYPTKKLRIPVNKKVVLENGIVAAKDSAKILDYLDWDLEGNALEKKDMLIIDMIANNNWKRPMYFAVTAGYSSKSFLYLDKYFQLEGLAYKVIPIKTEREGLDMGKVATDNMYKKVMAWDWDNFGNTDLYMDETYRRTSSWSVRNNVARLANALVDEGKDKEAIEVLDLLMKNIPTSMYSKNHFIMGVIEGYYRAGANKKGAALLTEYFDDIFEEVKYYSRFSVNKQNALNNDIRMKLSEYQSLLQLAAQTDKELFHKYEPEFRNLIALFNI